MTTYYIDKLDNFDEMSVSLSSLEDEKPYEFMEGLNPPPRKRDGSTDPEIIQWVKSLVNESYTAMTDQRNLWYSQLMMYLTVGTLSEDVSLGARVDSPAKGKPRNENLIFRPPLLKTRVDFAADWLSHQITKPLPFVQYVNYDPTNIELTQAQRLYERKLQDDIRKYAGRRKFAECFRNLNLYGNAVVRASFHQERMLTKKAKPSMTLENKNPFDDQDLTVTSKKTKPDLVYEILDQYGEFENIFLGNYICDPYPKGGDPNNATYKGHIDYVSSEELYDMFKDVKHVKKFLPILGNSANNFSSTAYNSGGDLFTNTQFLFNCSGIGVDTARNGKSLHTLTYIETRKTETCIIDNQIVAYHRIRDAKIKRKGPWSYVHFMVPSTSNSTWGIGLGFWLRQLQGEQNQLASMRMQYLTLMYKPFIEIINGGGVDAAELLNGDAFNALIVKQPGSVNFKMPAQGSENIFQPAEQSNIERTRFYASQPAMIDGSTDKTHLTGAAQRMEAGQIPFDVLLSITRDGINDLYNMIHELNLAYLEGDLPVNGTSDLNNPDTMANTITQEQLDLLRASRNSLQLFAGQNLAANKLELIPQLMQSPTIDAQLKGLSPINGLALTSEIFDAAGLNNISKIITRDIEQKAQQSQMGPPPQPGIGPQGTLIGDPQGGAAQGAGAQGIPPEIMQQMMASQGGQPQPQSPPPQGIPG